MDAGEQESILHKMADAIKVIDEKGGRRLWRMSRSHPFYILFEYLQETRGQNPTVEEICAEVDRIDREYDKGLTMAECVALERMKTAPTERF